MAAEGLNSFVMPKLPFFILLVIVESISAYTYPLFGGKRYMRPVPLRRSAYIPLPVSRHHDYQLPDYDDGFMPPSQDEYEYNAYDKYPFVQYFGYYPTRDYYHDKTGRRIMNNFGYFDDQIPQDPIDDVQDEMIPIEKDDGYPYGQETWYEEELPRYDSNAEANAAFMQNLILAQMYQDARSQYPYGYDPAGEDYDDQHWFYGVPTTEVEDKEKVQQYFKNKEDEEVKELQSLTRKKEKNKKIKGKNGYKKQDKMELIEKPAKGKSKMTDDEYFDMQKQIVVNSRKNNYAPIPEGFRINKKQIYNPTDLRNNIWDFYEPRINNPEPTKNSKQKLNLSNDGKNTKVISDSKIKVESTTATVHTTASPKKPAVIGQKEVVLPRPSNPVRRPASDLSTRSLHQPSVYDTIKRLLNMEEDLQRNKPQPQKRFVSSEDELTAELSRLKKL